MLLYIFLQGRMKLEKVHSIYKRLLAIDDVDPTLVSSYISFCHSKDIVNAA